MRYLYFSAPWCGPCKAFGPIMEQVSREVVVEKINVDEQGDLAMQYGVRSVPTVILVDHTGKEYTRHVGIQQKSFLMENYNNFTNV
jgi:thioredoxin 1